MKKLISIIVPVYNMEQYLERCVNSIIKQTYENLEVILVDDGSTDSSPEMCDDYAKKDSRIKVVHKKNGGLSDARNAGLALASGEYIGYVDSDDWIEPDMYKRLYEACEQNQAQIAICRYAQVCQGKREEEGNGMQHVFGKEELLRVYITGDEKYIIYNSVWSKLYRRDIVAGEIFPVGRNSEDIMYTTKAFCKAEKTVYIDQCFYNYVMDREGSIMNVKRGERMFEDEIPFWREHIEYITEHVSAQMGALAAYHFYRRLLFYFVDLYKEKETRKYASLVIIQLRQDRKQIKKIYKNDFVSKGDYVRMQLIQGCPWFYATSVVLYDKWIIPIRKRNLKRRQINAF